MGKQLKSQQRPLAGQKNSQVKEEHDPPVVKEQPLSEPAQQPAEAPQNNQNAPKSRKHNRIIIRNLVVDINEKHLRKLCSKFGQIIEVNIPRHPVKNYSKGFAFVEFATKNMCLKAIKNLNATDFKGRKIVVDLAVAKKAYDSQKQEQVNIKNEGKMEVEEEAVVKKQQAEDKEQQEAQNESKQAKAEVKKEHMQKDRAEELERTIFIRNLPTDATEQELFSFFRRYGKLKFAKVVMDKQTMESRGTGFVLFREQGIAQKLIEYSKEYEKAQTAKGGSNFKEDPTINLEFKGKIVKIFPAEERNALSAKLKDRESGANDNSKTKVKPIKKINSVEELVELDKHSKRNLIMALEGMFTPQKWMRNEDHERMEAHVREKVEKLKNPNNFVSQTRIVMKNLDKSLTEDEILTFCKSFLNQQFQGNQKLLTYCKLMLDKERVKSTGIAFVEFRKKEVSQGFLKWLQENRTEIFHPKQAVIAEFVIQDSRKMAVVSKKVRKVKV